MLQPRQVVELGGGERDRDRARPHQIEHRLAARKPGRYSRFSCRLAGFDPKGLYFHVNVRCVIEAREGGYPGGWKSDDFGVIVQLWML